MHLDLHILADADDAVKYIFGALFVLIWIAGAITSAAKKKQQEYRRRMETRPGQERRGPTAPVQAMQPGQQSWQEIYQGLTGGAAGFPPSTPAGSATPPPLPRQAQRVAQRNEPPMPGPQNQNRKDPRGPRRNSAQAKPPQAPPAPVEVEPAFTRASATAEVMPAVEAIASGAIGARQTEGQRRPPASGVASQLTAAGLKRQFILTEILRPPVTMRDEEAR